MTAFFMKINIEGKYLNLFDEIGSVLGRDHVFLVGGFVRDTLLGKESHDLDIATSLPPEKVKEHFPSALCFPKYGTFSFKRDDIHVTIACMREEGEYVDYRHPSHIRFVDSILEDHVRRDLTINCLYVSSSMEVDDPTGFGLYDIRHHLIRIIGDKRKRLLEDPLRIIRAYRFQMELGFSLEKETEEALISSLPLLSHLNPDKITEEIRKADRKYQDELRIRLKLDSRCDIIKTGEK